MWCPKVHQVHLLRRMDWMAVESGEEVRESCICYWHWPRNARRSGARGGVEDEGGSEQGECKIEICPPNISWKYAR